MRRWIVLAAAAAVALSAQAPAANALALRWEFERVPDFVEEYDVPAGDFCDFVLHVRNAGSYQLMYGYDSNGVLRKMRWQNWGPYDISISADNGTSLSLPMHQSLVMTFTFDEQGELIRIVNTGIDSLYVAPGIGAIRGVVGRFIVVDDVVVWMKGMSPNDESAQLFCGALG